MNEDVKELLSVSKDDFWAYPGLALLVAACFFENIPLVAGLMAGASLFFAFYFIRSTPKYVRKSNLRRLTRVLGVVGNALVLAIILGVAWWKLSLLNEGVTMIEFLRGLNPQEQREDSESRAT